MITEYLARQLETAEGGQPYADVLRKWNGVEGAFFAQAWCEATARKPAVE